jgi:hypothetical protein
MSDDQAPEQAPKIHVDDDWKAQAQAEKKRLADQTKQSQSGGEAKGAPRRGQLPEANFETLISTMATQAMFAMGLIPDPASGQRMQHLDLARHHIDMLGVLEEKTKGNLSEEETTMLSQTAYELRQQYIQMSSAARQR